MTGTLQPLDSKFAIVDRNGNPTDYFIRWAQQKQIDIGSSITLTDLANYLAAHKLASGQGIALTPDGNLADSPSISVLNGTGLDFDVMHNLKLADTAVVPGTYGDATHVPAIVVDQQGRITGVTLVAISGGGGGSWPAATAPGQIGGLVGWWDSSLLAAPAASAIYTLNSPDPLRVVNPVNNSKCDAIVGATKINSLNVVTFSGNVTTSSLVMNVGTTLPNSTAFVVHKPGAMVAGSSYTFFSGLVNSLTFRLTASAANVAKLDIVKAQVVDIGQSTTTVITGTAFQGNYTYNGSAYSYRIAKAAAGSGTNAQSITAATTNMGVETTGLSAPLNGDLAELILYARVLTLAEIQAVEAYLTAKWGV